MIRLPATSISLSENDLRFHLQQVDIYHGLLKQGFKKKDILRYFEEHNAVQQPRQTIDLGPPSLSCVDLVSRGQSAVPPPPAPSTKPAAEGSTSLSTALLSTLDVNADDHREATDTPLPSSPDLSAGLPEDRHAPRQSSLLRFSQNLPSSSSSHSETISSQLNLPARTYRPRTDTYSYNQSEASDSELVGGISDLSMESPLVATRKRFDISSRSWAEAETFVPGRLRPTPTRSTSYRLSEDLVGSPLASPYVHTDHIDLTIDIATTPRLVTQHNTMRLSADANISPPMSNMPSSPPYISLVRGARDHEPLTSSSPSLPRMPTTPTPIRQAVRDARTEPHRPRHQYLDGASFPVFNDALPANTQPQTPADLARHLLLTEFDAAYTAPPGVVYTGSPMRRQRLNTSAADPAHSEQSPTVHAMGTRERRARELMRSVRAEGTRLQRLRLQDRERIARGLDGNDELRDRDGPGPAVTAEIWRDDFEGDRVGDENWEAEAEWTERGRDGMRVVSGNARGRWWEQ